MPGDFIAERPVNSFIHLAAASFYDLTQRRIPNRIVLPAALSSVLFGGALVFWRQIPAGRWRLAAGLAGAATAAVLVATAPARVRDFSDIVDFHSALSARTASLRDVGRRAQADGLARCGPLKAPAAETVSVLAYTTHQRGLAPAGAEPGPVRVVVPADDSVASLYNVNLAALRAEVLPGLARRYANAHWALYARC